MNDVTAHTIVVLRAVELGWQGREHNHYARRHFYFEGPGRFEVHWHQGCPSFTVGDTTTSYQPRAIELLEALVAGAVRPADAHA